jgi:hypothetical protein
MGKKREETGERVKEFPFSFFHVLGMLRKLFCSQAIILEFQKS